MMSKCILTRKKSDHSKLVNGFVNFDFKIGFSLVMETFQITFFKKLGSLKSSIFASEDKSSFCTAVGTFIYKQKTGINAYKQVLEDFRLNKSISDIRLHSIGMYTLYIYFSNNLYIFSDIEASHLTYYYNAHGRFISTQTYYHIAKLVKSEVEEQSLNEAIFLSGFIGDQSPFKNIYKLQAEKSISFIDGNFSIEQLNLRKINRSNNYSADLNKVVEAYKFNFDSPAISMTGGIDSRTILGFYLSNGMRPTLLHGQGNSYLTNTHVEDYELVKRISNSVKLEHQLLDFSDSVPYKKNWHKNLEKYGEFFHIYGSNENYINSYVKRHHDLIHFGLVGERLRKNFSVEEKKRLSISNVTNSIFYPKFMPRYIYSKNRFKKLIKCKLKNIFKPANFKIGNIDYVFRNVRNNELINFFNLFVASDSFFTSSLPTSNFVKNILPEDRLDAKLQIQLIKLNYPQLLEIPFFSHQRFTSFEENVEISLRRKFKNFFKKIPGIIFLFKFFRNGLIKNKYYNDDLKKFIEEEWKSQTGKDIPKGDIRYFYRWLQYRYMVSEITK